MASANATRINRAGSRLPAALPLHLPLPGALTLLLLLLASSPLQAAGFSAVSGSGTMPGQSVDASALFGSQSALIGSLLLLGLITLFIATLIYMFGLAFNLPTYKSWAKSEFMQILVTFLLAVSILAVYGQIWSLMINAVSGYYTVSHPELADPTLKYEPFSFAQAYISTTLIDCEKTVYRTLYTVNFYYRLVGRFQTEVIGADATGGWSTGTYAAFFEYIAGHINYLLLLNYLQIHLLSLIKYAMPLMLAIGLVLRAFPITRGTGGLLIAIGLGFYIVYPVSLAMLMTLLPSASNAFCTGFTPPPLLDLTTDGGVVQTSGDLLQAGLDVQASQKSVGNLRSQIETFLPVFYLQGMFLPLVALTITFTFFRQTGTLFGADLAEIGRGLIKLI